MLIFTPLFYSFDAITQIKVKRIGCIATSVVHETLVVDCQIHHFPLDLTIQREQIVIY
jgi:hypothetical protein